MAEKSYPWGGTSIGDATLAPYSDDAWSDLWQVLFLRDRTLQGVLAEYLNELAVSGTSSPVNVATGGSVVDGKVYLSDGAVAVAIPTPGGSTRIDYIVLRKDWTAQTVRITRIAGAEGGGAPSLTQSDGSLWDVPLATVSITTGGVITVTDKRNMVAARIGPPPYIPLSIDASKAPMSGVTAAAQQQIESSGAGTQKPVITELLFVTGTNNGRIWEFQLPRVAGTLKLKVFYRMSTSSGSKSLKLDAFVAAMSSGDGSASAKVFAASNSQTDTPPSTSDVIGEMTITLTNFDNAAAGDWFQIFLQRDTGVANNHGGTAKVFKVQLVYG